MRRSVVYKKSVVGSCTKKAVSEVCGITCRKGRRPVTFLRALYVVRFGAHAISAEDVGRGEFSGCLQPGWLLHRSGGLHFTARAWVRTSFFASLHSWFLTEECLRLAKILHINSKQNALMLNIVVFLNFGAISTPAWPWIRWHAKSPASPMNT